MNDLARLLDAHAFNPTPSEVDLARLHVPFDELTGRLDCEQAMVEALRRGERVALIGPTGSGKSSITEHVLDSWVADLAPIRVRVGLEPDTVSTDPAQFVVHVVRTVAKYLAGSAEEKKAQAIAKLATGPHPTRPVTVTAGAGPSWLHGELAVQVRSVLDSVGPTGQDVLEQAQLILQLISATGLLPVLVLDDTDHWLVRPGLPAPDALRAGFFGHIVRVIAESLPAAAVIAVHETYLRDPNYLDASSFFETRMTLPAVPDAAGLGRILAHRAQRCGVLNRPIGSIDLIADDALDRLYAHYDAGARSLRRHMQVAHGALTYAGDAGAARIELVHVDLAIADQ